MMYKYGLDPATSSTTPCGGGGGLGAPGPSLSSSGGHATLATGASHTHLNALGTVNSGAPVQLPHNNISPVASLAVSGIEKMRLCFFLCIYCLKYLAVVSVQFNILSNDAYTI